MNASAGPAQPGEAHGVAAGRFVHTPFPDAPLEAAHTWQPVAAPPHGVLQQTPSAQDPLEQSAAEMHTDPWGFGAGETQVPVEQM